MGADGSILIVKRADWDANSCGVTPDQAGLYDGVILDVDAVWAYDGDNLPFGGHYGEDPSSYFMTFEATPEQLAQCKQAISWFEQNCERHEVWT
jgi:hypothetical protein